MIALTLPLLIAAAAQPADGVAVRRFALIAAANNGGAERVALRYAQSDADSFAQVLRQLGGVAERDELRVLEPSREDLDSALDELARRIKTARESEQRVELLLYYSGHSDMDGLLLGEERFAYRDLQARLSAVAADVSIVVLDSCASGAMTRTKGGIRRPPFVVDASNRVQGSAILTSSSEDEAAQESDQLGGSFFTHYLVSGLRGAGDVTGDGRVTLNEAYQFAFHETLRRTEATLGGPQHPAYSFRLSGSGDVVMTDIRSTGAGLHLEESLYGHLFLRDLDGRLAVELRKPAGRPVQLGLEPGPYEVTLLQDGVQFQGHLQLVDGRDQALDPAALQRVEGEATTLRGAGSHPAARRVVPVDIGIIPPLSVNGFSEPTLNHLSVSLGMSYGHDLEGVQLAIGTGWMEARMQGVQASVGLSHVGGDASGLQWAVGLANTGGSFEGFQAAVGASIAGGGLVGWQTSVGLNVVAGALEGVQSAVGLNVASGAVHGGQMGVGLNVADQVSGFQLSSGLNVASQIDGLQLGMVNVAGTSKGLQLGLVNIVEKSEGVSLGLLSYATQDGILDLKLSSSDVGLLGVALEVGTKYLYTGLGVAGGTWEVPDALGLLAYLGGRVQVNRDWSVDLEVGARWMDDNRDFADADLIATARVVLGYRLGDGLTLFLGPALHTLVDLHDAGPDRATLAPRYAARPNDSRAYLWPGLNVGVRLF